MKNLNNLIKTMNQNQVLISDPMSLYYLMGEHFEVGERFISLLICKDSEPVLFLNSLFSTNLPLKVIKFSDSDEIYEVVKGYLIEGPLGIDGSMPFRFSSKFMVNHTLYDGSFIIEKARRIKSKDEQEAMRIASSVNDEIMNKVVESIKIGMTEQELASLIYKFQTTDPVKKPSFEPIALFSENAADPHGIPSDRKLKENDMVLIDMGGMVNGYASDMTRCFFMGDNPELESIYEIVLKAQQSAINAVEIGKPLSSIDIAARSVIEEAGYGPYFLHRTGHGIGLEAHENLDVSSVNHTLIEPGMCFSIEPGIYLEGIGGVRIEDLITITENGVEVLNTYPKNLMKLK